MERTLSLLAVEGILIPLKRFEISKSRLARLFGPAARRRLGPAMLEDVLATTRPWPCFVVTSDREGIRLAVEKGCTVIKDPGGGLNAAILEGTAAAMEVGVTSLLVLPADVPLVTTSDLRWIFQAPASLVITPSRDGGTNALLRRPPDVVWPDFGDSSAAKHCAQAQQKGLTVTVYRPPTLVLDIDEPEDLVQLGALGGDSRSALVARELLSSVEGWGAGAAHRPDPHG